MQIAGKSYGTSSVTKGLARHRMAERDKAKSASDKAAHPEMPGGAGGGSEHDHGGEDGGHEIIQQMHSEHGPAHKIDVTTHHEDGHTHTSKGHPSAEHAQAHIGHATGSAGGDEGQTEGEMSEDGAGSLEDMGLGGE